MWKGAKIKKKDKIVNFPVVESLSDEELEDFNPIVIDSVRKICVFSDKHNFDRNSMLSYFAGTLKTFSEIASIENYEL